MKKHLENLKNEQGLTLVELLAVIVILAVVAVIGFVMIGKVIENSKKDAHISQAIQMIESAKLQKLTAPDSTDEFAFTTLLEDGEVFRNAWTKEEFNPTDLGAAKVEINLSTGEYSVTGFEGKDSNGDTKCNINGQKEEDLLKKADRDTICGG